MFKLPTSRTVTVNMEQVQISRQLFRACSENSKVSKLKIYLLIYYISAKWD